MTMREDENPFGYNHNLCQLFGLSKETIFSLTKIAKEEKIDIEEPVYLYDKPVWRYKDNPVMGFLTQQLFSRGQKKYNEPQEHIRICHAKSPREEVEAVAGQIRRLVRKENYCYRDIAIVVPCMDVYSYFINEVFADYAIPVFMDSKRSILLNSFVEYLRSLLSMTEQNFTYESVLRYLRTGMTCLSTEEVDRLENYIRAAGLRGYNRWKNEWVKTTRMVDEEGLVQMNQLRERLVNEIDDAVEVLKRRHKTIADITTALHDLFLKIKIQQKIKEYEVYFANAGKAVLAKEYAQIYRIMMDLFDQFVSLLGEEKISLKEYCDLLDAGLSHAQVGTIPPTLDGVVVGDIERSRLPEVRAVFVLGLNDAYIPGTT